MNRSRRSGVGTLFTDRLWQLTLPAVALSIGYGAYVTWLTTAAISQEARADHVVTPRGRGLPSACIPRRHIVRNAALPMLTTSG